MAYFWNVQICFNAKLWIIYPLCALQVFIQKGENSRKKEKKNSNCNSLCRDTFLSVATQKSKYWQRSCIATKDSVSRQGKQEESRNSIATRYLLSRQEIKEQHVKNPLTKNIYVVT